VKAAVVVDDNRLSPRTDAVTVAERVDASLLVGVPVITAFAPGRLLERVVRVSPGGRLDVVKVTLFGAAVTG
jgi:hypothetical protein